MNDLVEFLKARIDEDEQIAKGASPPPWHEDGMAIRAGARPYAASITDTLVVRHTWPQESAHIIRHDPARALRDVAFKREILSAYQALAVSDDTTRWHAGELFAMEAVIRSMAAIYQ